MFEIISSTSFFSFSRSLYLFLILFTVIWIFFFIILTIFFYFIWVFLSPFFVSSVYPILIFYPILSSLFYFAFFTLPTKIPAYNIELFYKFFFLTFTTYSIHYTYQKLFDSKILLSKFCFLNRFLFQKGSSRIVFGSSTFLTICFLVSAS